MWDSKYLMGGNTFISPLMNYLENKESEEDRNKAKFSIFRSMVLKIPWILFFVQLKASDAKKNFTKKGVKLRDELLRSSSLTNMFCFFKI